MDAFIRTVPKGKVTTVEEIRKHLSTKHSFDTTTCPVTTGIFVRIAAEAAEEEACERKVKITPYWRVVKADGSMNPKFPGGLERQAERLRAEGHRIRPGAGKRPPRVLSPIL